MNCRNIQQLNITCGTDVVLHDKLMFDDEVFDPNVSVDIECSLVNSLGKRTSLEYEIADEVLIIQIPWVDGRNAGCYGLEVKGKCNGKTWATYADSLIRYTRATVEGASVVEVSSDWYDITQVVSYRYSDSPLDEVDATIDDNYGEPTVTPTYEHNKLTLDFKNLRGNGIASVEQTVTSTGDEGVNEATITQDNGNTTVIQVRNGSKGSKGDKGDTGDSAIFDPSTGNISEIKQATGNSIVSPMSQKAVTDELDSINGVNDITDRFVFSEKKFVTARKATSSQTQVVGNIYIAGSTATQCTESYVPISDYDKLRIAIVNSTADNLISGLVFYDASKAVVGTICKYSSAVNDNVVEYIDIPSGAMYVRTTITTAGNTPFVAYGIRNTNLAELTNRTESPKTVKITPTKNWRSWFAKRTYNPDINGGVFAANNGRALYIIPDASMLAGKTVTVNFNSSKFNAVMWQSEIDGLNVHSTNINAVNVLPPWQTSSFSYKILPTTKSIFVILKKTNNADFGSADDIDDGDVEITYNTVKDSLPSTNPKALNWKSLSYFDDRNGAWDLYSTTYPYKRACVIIPHYVVPGSFISIKVNSGYNVVLHEFKRYDLSLGYYAFQKHLYQGVWENTISKQLHPECEVIALIVRKSDDSSMDTTDMINAITELDVEIQSDDFVQPKKIKSGYYTGDRINLGHSYQRVEDGTLTLHTDYNYLSAMDIHGDYIIGVYPEYKTNGSAASGCKGSIYNRKTKTTICDIDFPLGEYDIPHANTACFGVEYAEGNTDFPLFYISQWNKDGGILVYNIIKDSDTEFHAELVQAIMPDTGIDETIFGVRVRGDWVIDKENDFLYSVRYKYDSSFTPVNGNANNTMVTKFALPKLSDGELVTLYTDDILDSFILPPTPVLQDKCMENGKIYLLCGWAGSEAPNSQYIYVVDVERKQIVSKVDLTQYGLEPECACIDGDIILYTYYLGSGSRTYVTLYSLKF